MVNINKAPVTSSFEAALAHPRTQAAQAPMAGGAVVAYEMRVRALVKDANDTTWGSLAWSPPA